MIPTKEERQRHVARMLANVELEGGLPDAEHLALLERYIEGTASLADLYDHAHEYVTTVKDREETERSVRKTSAQLALLYDEYERSSKVHDEERRQAALANIRTSDEQRRRQDAVNYARTSLALSGFEATDTFEREAARFIHGEISMAELITILGK